MSEAIQKALSVRKTNGESRPALTRKDFVSDQEIRWCPGCGDYSILAQVQKIMPELGVAREDTVFVSGIGCSSRFPYYMNTYGFHSIHGRAPAIATGIKASRPELSVWVATGDGDGLSIGGNHLIHALRRNVDLKILLFNNRIYGLTKGQYSPTSEFGKRTKSTPLGSVDHPFNPVSVALGAEATFVARAIDTDAKHLQETLKRAAAHKGGAFVEIFQNCNVFNDDAFAYFTEKAVKNDRTLYLEHHKPMLYAGGKKGIGLDPHGLRPFVVDVKGDEDLKQVLVHDESVESPGLAFLLSRLDQPDFPIPLGVLRNVQKPTYDALIDEQGQRAIAQRGEKATLKELLYSGDIWNVK
jgi:2-oxoglutarate ferredoxin oxidoreductase subunit beta